MHDLVVAGPGGQTEGDRRRCRDDLAVAIAQGTGGRSIGREERRGANLKAFLAGNCSHLAAAGEDLRELAGGGGNPLQSTDTFFGFKFFLIRREGEKHIANRALFRNLQLRGAGLESGLQFLVCHLHVLGCGGCIPAKHLKIERTDTFEGRSDLARHDNGRRSDQSLHPGQAEGVTDHGFELALGEAPRRQLLLQELRILHGVELPLGLEDRERFDFVHHSLIAGLDAEPLGFVLQDHEVPDEVVGSLVFRLRLPGKIAHQIELPQSQGELVVAHRFLDVHLHHVASVDFGHDVGPHPLEVRRIVEPGEGDDGERGDESHEPALVLADRGEHRTIVLKSAKGWLNWSG